MLQYSQMFLPKKPRKKGLSKKVLLKKAEIAFSLYIRNRDKRCMKCGKTTNLQCSHVKSVGAYKFLQFEPQNAIALCTHCHLYWWHKEPTEAGEWFKKTFPNQLKYLERRILAKNTSLIKQEINLEEVINFCEKANEATNA